MATYNTAQPGTTPVVVTAVTRSVNTAAIGGGNPTPKVGQIWPRRGS